MGEELSRRDLLRKLALAAGGAALAACRPKSENAFQALTEKTATRAAEATKEADCETGRTPTVNILQERTGPLWSSSRAQAIQECQEMGHSGVKAGSREVVPNVGPNWYISSITGKKVHRRTVVWACRQTCPEQD
jgi:hypothetical protein